MRKNFCILHSDIPKLPKDDLFKKSDSHPELGGCRWCLCMLVCGYFMTTFLTAASDCVLMRTK